MVKVLRGLGVLSRLPDVSLHQVGASSTLDEAFSFACWYVTGCQSTSLLLFIESKIGRDTVSAWTWDVTLGLIVQLDSPVTLV